MSSKTDAKVTLFQKIRSLLTRRDKKVLILVGIATILVSMLEVANLSLTMVFIAAITKFNTLHTHKYVIRLFKYTGPLTNSQIILFLGIFLIVFYFFRCCIVFFHTYKMQNYLEHRRYFLSFRFFQNYLNFNYQQFAQENPATINKLVFTDASNILTILSACMVIFADSFTIFLIYLSLLFINWKMTLVLTFLLCTKVILILKTCSHRLTKHGAKSALHNRNISKIFNESYRNFKLVKLLGHEQYILSRFTTENKNLIQSNVMNKVLQETPRIFLETIGLSILVGAVIYVVYRISTPEYIIPILSMYALAFYRFMPSLTRIMNGYNQIKFSRGTINLSNDLMYQTKKLGDEPIEFTRSIQLKNFSFGYQKNKNVFTNVSLDIKKQSRIAFIGESGAGKSTLADIIMGFYLPEQGSIYIDNQKLTHENIKSWRSNIGYIPQQIYLFDATVAENIVFGRQYDEEKIIRALKKANIYDFLMQKEGLLTKVGEGGILLSGGQMQRIAIARALYSDPKILILDEATSALDNDTETNIMNEIYSFHEDKTLIIIAHRLSTILRCEKIYKVENEKIILVDKKELHDKYLSLSKTGQTPAQPQS